MPMCPPCSVDQVISASPARQAQNGSSGSDPAPKKTRGARRRGRSIHETPPNDNKPVGHRAKATSALSATLVPWKGISRSRSEFRRVTDGKRRQCARTTGRDTVVDGRSATEKTRWKTRRRDEAVVEPTLCQGCVRSDCRWSGQTSETIGRRRSCRRR